MDVMYHEEELKSLPNNLHVDVVAYIAVGVGCCNTMAIQSNDELMYEEEQLVEHHHLVADKVHLQQQQQQQLHSLDDDHSNCHLHKVDNQ